MKIQHFQLPDHPSPEPRGLPLAERQSLGRLSAWVAPSNKACSLLPKLSISVVGVPLFFSPWPLCRMETLLVLPGPAHMSPSPGSFPELASQKDILMVSFKWLQHLSRARHYAGPCVSFNTHNHHNQQILHYYRLRVIHKKQKYRESK